METVYNKMFYQLYVVELSNILIRFMCDATLSTASFNYYDKCVENIVGA